MKAKKFQAPLMMILSMWVLFFPTYVHSYNLTQADFLARPHWENPFQERLLAGLHKKWEVPAWKVFFLMSNKEDSLFELPSDLSCQYRLAGQEISILRC